MKLWPVIVLAALVAGNALAQRQLPARQILVSTNGYDALLEGSGEYFPVSAAYPGSVQNLFDWLDLNINTQVLKRVELQTRVVNSTNQLWLALTTLSNMVVSVSNYVNTAKAAAQAAALAQAVTNGVPPGTVIVSAGVTAPARYLACDGQALSKTTYAALYAAIGDRYTAHPSLGSPTAGNFRVPDYRGLFLRGANLGRADGLMDPDAGTRSNIFNDGDPGTIDAQLPGSYQWSENLLHGHALSWGVYSYNDPAGIIPIPKVAAGLTVANTLPLAASTSGGNESRPKNMTVNYYIKY